MFELENNGHSIELPIGTRFYFRGSLYEAVELKGEEWVCSQCAFNKRNEEDICKVMICYEDERRDEKRVFFEEITETRKG